jgi:type I restriction enzyme S subunit
VPKILKISGCINDGSVAFFDLKPSVSKDFLYYFFRSQTEDLRIRMYQGMGQPNLNTGLVSSIRVPMPPPREQVQIAEKLDEVVEHTRRLIGAIREGIARLEEYRAALISAAVTGQIDVRGEVTE